MWDVAGVTSGQISAAINEANAFLQGFIGGTVSGDAVLNEQVLRFEVNYASAKVLLQIFGGTTTDGFNYSVGGLAVQRLGAKLPVYEQEINTRMALAKHYITILHEWFIAFNPTYATGYTERGVPVTYWSTSQPRY